MMDSRVAKSLLEDIIQTEIKISALIREIASGKSGALGLADLNHQVKAETTLLRRRIKDLDDLALECPVPEDRDALLKESKKHCEEMTGFRAALRRANLDCQMAISRRNTDELFRVGEGDVVKSTREERTKESIANSAAEVTNDLRAVARMMAEQVDRSKLTVDVLASSSQHLDEVRDEFKSQNHVIAQAHNLLTKYGRREFTDKLLIFAAFAFFVACVLYVVQKRLF